MKSETRETLKSILAPLGLEDAARSLYHRAGDLRDKWVMTRYRNAKVFTTAVDGATLRFSLEDPYSRDWFLPRYAGGRLHEKSVTLLMAEQLRSARCFVDVGTNLGWFTCLAGALMPEGRVYGFEMDDQNFALLQRNLALNGCQNAVVRQAAVSDASGTASYARDENAPSSVLKLAADDGAPPTARRTIRSISLDDFFRDEAVLPDLIKIDVEGAEMKVLEGAKQVLERGAPTLFLEIHPLDLPGFGSSSTEVLSFLTDRGYSAAQIVDMRSQRGDVKLQPLPPGSSVDVNCMVFLRRV